MIRWKHLAVAGKLRRALNGMHAYLFPLGLGGLVCGRAASTAKDHPDTALPLLACTAGSAVVGVALGVGVAVYRKAPVHVYGLSVGANFALCSFTFFGEMIRKIYLLPNACRSLS